MEIALSNTSLSADMKELKTRGPFTVAVDLWLVNFTKDSKLDLSDADNREVYDILNKHKIGLEYVKLHQHALTEVNLHGTKPNLGKCVAELFKGDSAEIKSTVAKIVKLGTNKISTSATKKQQNIAKLLFGAKHQTILKQLEKYSKEKLFDTTHIDQFLTALKNLDEAKAEKLKSSVSGKKVLANFKAVAVAKSFDQIVKAVKTAKCPKALQNQIGQSYGVAQNTSTNKSALLLKRSVFKNLPKVLEILDVDHEAGEGFLNLGYSAKAKPTFNLIEETLGLPKNCIARIELGLEGSDAGATIYFKDMPRDKHTIVVRWLSNLENDDIADHVVQKLSDQGVASKDLNGLVGVAYVLYNNDTLENKPASDVFFMRGADALGKLLQTKLGHIRKTLK